MESKDLKCSYLDSIPKIFKDQEVYVIGGGDSLRHFDWKLLEGKPSIAVNTAFRVVPNATVLFFSDPRFYRQHGNSFHRFKGEHILTTLEITIGMHTDSRVRSVKMSKTPFCKDGKRIGNSGNSGTKAINLAYAMGAAKVILLGFDADVTNPTLHWHAGTPLAHNGGSNPAIAYNLLQDMCAFYEDMQKKGIDTNFIYNASPDSCYELPKGEIRIDNIDPITNINFAREELERVRQRDKYEYIWNQQGYRRYSPALRDGMNGFFSMLQEEISSCELPTLYDVGAGTGLATLDFAKRGFGVVPIDIAANCLNEEVPQEIKESLIVAPTWRLPVEMPKADFVFCCDLMEHIPPELVEKSLEQLAKISTKGAYYQICTTHVGTIKGTDDLHLTVQPAEWWLDTLSKFYVLKNHAISGTHVKVAVLNVGD